jgi:preprotein translocase SecF subunit
MFDIIGKRYWYFLISALLIIPGLLAMAYSTVTYGAPVRLSIDFTGGSLMVIKFQQPATEDAIRDVFMSHGFTNPVVQQLGRPEDNTWQVRMGFVEIETVDKIKASLADQIGPIDEASSSFSTVGPAVGSEVTRAATVAVVIASLLVGAFIIITFRRVPNAFRYGVCAISAMAHDILVALGFISIMGLLFNWEVDALFLTAILTVIGFSVQDKIVVFDRIRENTPKRRGEPFETIVNRSILETLHRSLATQLNAMFVMIAILLFGGASIKQFIAVMLIGMVTATYSSIFNAVPVLVAWENGEVGRFFRRVLGRRTATGVRG